MPFVDNDGISIYYESHGSGEPVVLLHGAGGPSDVWHELGWVETLSRRYQVVTIDARAFGKSDKPTDEAAYVTKTRVDDVLSVLDELDLDRGHLSGYSMGAGMCFSMLAYAPERILSVAAGGAHLQAKDLSWVRDLVMPRFKEWEAAGRPEVPVSPAGVLAILNADEASTAVEPDEITVPTLIYSGTADLHYEQIKQTAQEIPGARFMEYEGEDHSVFRTRHEEVRTAVAAFLDEVSGAE